MTDQPDTQPTMRYACPANRTLADDSFLHCVLQPGHDGPHATIKGWTFTITAGKFLR